MIAAIPLPPIATADEALALAIEIHGPAAEVWISMDGTKFVTSNKYPGANLAALMIGSGDTWEEAFFDMRVCYGC